jgi:FkbM family methyltransferase
MVRIIQLFKTIIPFRIWNTLRSWFFIAKRYLTNDYSQSGETGIIRELLQKGKDETGFFIEIGANDGITVSNTFGLIKKGWAGLSVEANPDVFKLLQRNLKRYPKVKTVCVAVAPEKGPIKLYLGKNDPQGLLSTISTEHSAWFEEHRSEEYRMVPGIPLTQLLDEHGIISNPDVLIIDAEAMDYEILLSLDFTRYRPTLIVTEDYQAKNDLKFQLLKQVGYHFERQVGCNTFWRRQS